MQLDSEITFESTELPHSYFNFFQDVRNEKKFCDVTFIVDTKPISAHRLIVSAAIPYFRDKLINVTRDTEIAVPIVDPDVFRSLVEFAYTRKVKITVANVRSLLSGACLLQVYEVRKACCNFIADRLSLENVISMRAFASSLDCSELLEDTEWYVAEYFEEVSEREDFLSLPYSFFEKLVQRDDLRTTSEEKVYEVIMRWVENCPLERKEYLPELLGRVRWLSIEPEYLSFHVAKAELIRVSPSCRDVLDDVKNYHLFPEHPQATKSFSFPTKPRWLLEGNDEYIPEKGETADSFLVDAEYGHTLKRLQSSVQVEITKKAYAVYSKQCIELNKKHYFFSGGFVLEYDLKTFSYKACNGLKVTINVGAVSLNEKLYLCGGSDGVSASKGVKCFDPEEKKWKSVADMHWCRELPAVAKLGPFIYVLGGKDGECIHSSVEKLDSRDRKWRLKLPMLTERYASGSVAMNGKIYVCGGITATSGGKCVTTAEVYDPMENKWKFIASMKTARSHFSLLASDGRLHALGGKDVKGCHLQSFEIYDPKADKWY